MTEIEILNGGFVRLDNHMADDLSVVNSARVSFGKKTDHLADADRGLINFLMREHHGTPFEHNSFRFHIKVPIFVAREWFRHRAGWSYNEYSGRYSEMPEHYYIPDFENVRTQVGKPGSYTFEPIPIAEAMDVSETIDMINGHAFRTYNFLLAKGVAKELARTILPVGAYTEFYATCNARSLMHFVALRNDSNAQHEIRVAAKAVETIFADIMPVTHAAFIENGRVAP